MAEQAANADKKINDKDNFSSSDDRRSRHRGFYILFGVLAVIFGVGLAVGVLFLMNEIRGEEKEGWKLPLESPTPLPTVAPTLDSFFQSYPRSHPPIQHRLGRRSIPVRHGDILLFNRRRRDVKMSYLI